MKTPDIWFYHCLGLGGCLLGSALLVVGAIPGAVHRRKHLPRSSWTR